MASATIESVLQEDRLFPPSPEFVKQANVSGMAAYQALCDEAERDFEGFWARLARESLAWHKPFTKTLDESKAPFYKWLYHRVCQFANALKSLGIRQGERVLIYMPMSIEVVIAMQACARIGATHSVVFGGFSAKSVQERVIDAGAVALVTADGQMRGGKEIPLKPAIDEAFAMGGCEGVKNVIVYKRTGTKIAMQSPRDKWWDDAVKGQADTCEPTWVNAEHPLFILYTSGSTGKPKGVQHSTGGYLLMAQLTMKWVFDHKPNDIFWCTADVGWVTGHSYIVYGPLACGATEIMFEGVPVYPDAGRFWKMIQDHKVTVFYTAPTAIRSLIKAGGDLPKKYDLTSLRILGTVGEPINPEAWMWYHETVGGGRCPIVDTWWQTETGGHLITPLPGATTLPLPGIFADIVDETGHPVGRGKGGILVITRPWPSMLRTIWGDAERYKKTYWPDEFKNKLYLAGDGASTDEEGYFRIVGRIDDVLNVSGHRLGTMEIESALVANSKLVAEAAVVGRPDDLTGEAVCAFVVLKGARPNGEDAQKIARELRDWVGKEIGAIAKPKDIRFGDNLPKTRSGKIMRRLLRSIAKGEEIKQDVSTLENPGILEQLKQST